MLCHYLSTSSIILRHTPHEHLHAYNHTYIHAYSHPFSVTIYQQAPSFCGIHLMSTYMHTIIHRYMHIVTHSLSLSINKLQRSAAYASWAFLASLVYSSLSSTSFFKACEKQAFSVVLHMHFQLICLCSVVLLMICLMCILSCFVNDMSYVYPQLFC